MEPRRGFIFSLFAVALVLLDCSGTGAVDVDDLVYAEHFDDIVAHELAPGDENVQGVQLETAVHLYSHVYNYIYINTNGILTFGAGYPEFLNAPLPIEYAAIAPFYTNVDTTAGDPAVTSITYFESANPRLLRHLESQLYGAFPDDSAFEAVGAFVVTWSNVGHYDGKNEALNTFQAIIVSSYDKTYVQFLYPKGGLNWIQADIGASGLADVRAQAGFVSEDGRFSPLPGSGTANVKFLHSLSNYDENGSWWFLVGPLAYPSDVLQPRSDDHLSALTHGPQRQTCATHALRCHETAVCADTPAGFCCSCRDGYYGNGFTCLKAAAPIRVSGRISGQLNGEELVTQLQAYVSVADGQTFAAVTPLEQRVGGRLQLLQLLAAPIGWLFATPHDGAKNGYQLTGGRFNHTTTVRFHRTDSQVTVQQFYTGLNAWDQLEVAVVVSGELPAVAAGARVSFPNAVEEWVWAAETTLRSIGTSVVRVDEEELLYSVVQQIEYEESCEHRADVARVPFTDRPAVFNKVFKVSSVYATADLALRVGQSNKLTLKRDSSACTDGTAACGENTVCLAGVNDSYDCVCVNGFQPSSADQHSCTDIDECADASANICSPNAHCINQPGGYSCQCAGGFEGDGRTCTEQRPEEHYYEQPSSSSSPAAAQPTASDIVVLDHSSQYGAETSSQTSAQTERTDDDGVDEALDHGDSAGQSSAGQCDAFSVWSEAVGACVAADVQQPADDEIALDDDEVLPFCHLQGCSCGTGYELYDGPDGDKMCRRLPTESGANGASGSEHGGEHEDQQEKLPCDVENDCSPNASCEFIESVLRHRCVCHEGFDGDGHECVEQEVSCTIENICHELATCVYDEQLGMSVCRCDKGYEGDGRRHCEPEPECRESAQCAAFSQCVNGACECQEGYEKGQGDLCVLAGACGGAYCAENARCEWDAHEEVSYCQCPDGWLGDGVRECRYVPPPCNVRNNCGLNAACTPDYRDPAVYACTCNGGFNGDGFICTPEQNCQNTPALCDPHASCVSTPAGLRCACNPGFVGNGSQCAEPPRFDADFLLLSRGLSAIRVPLSGGAGGVRPVVMSHLIMGLDKDCTLGRVYWSDITQRTIWSARYDGTDKRAFIDTDVLSPEGVAVDWISRRLYWTDSEKDTVEVAALDDASVRAVIARKQLVNPRGIAVDPQHNKIFWSDWNRHDPKIEWANLDGSERQVLLASPHVSLPNHVAVSPRTRELCFADAGTKRIECIDTYRHEVHTVAANLSYPFGLAITDERFYWTDWQSRHIETVDHAARRQPPLAIPFFSNHRMYGLVAVTDDCPLFYSPCQVANGGCAADRICLVNERAPGGRSCKCLERADAECSDEDYEH